MSKTALNFSVPTLWYKGPEGNFLARKQKKHFEFPLRRITDAQIEAISNLQNADDQSLQGLIDDKWLFRPTNHQLTQSRYQAGVQKIHALHQAAYQPQLNTTEYHKNNMDEAFHQFDHVEITSSHLLRKPNEVLDGLTYAQKLANWLRQRIQPGAKILEIGGGTGVIANQLLTELVDLKVDYTLIDLSPQMQESQKQQCLNHNNIQFVTGDILKYNFSDAKFDFILCNEMIADLHVGIADKNNLKANQPQTEAEEYVLKYELAWEDAPPKFCVNTGAIDFLDRISDLLARGGQALVTEYGDYSYPKAVDLKGHREHSIHFGHLMSVAKALALSPQYLSVGDLFDVNPNIKVLRLDHIKVLVDVLAPFFGIKMPLIFYTQNELRVKWADQFENIGGLHFPFIRDQKDNKKAPGLSPFNFKAMYLKR